MHVAIRSSSERSVVASISGEVDASNSFAIPSVLLAAPLDGRDLIVDLADMTFMDSSGIAALCRLRDEVMPAGGELVLRNMQSNVRTVFRILGLADVFGLATGAQTRSHNDV